MKEQGGGAAGRCPAAQGSVPCMQRLEHAPSVARLCLEFATELSTAPQNDGTAPSSGTGHLFSGKLPIGPHQIPWSTQGRNTQGTGQDPQSWHHCMYREPGCEGLWKGSAPQESLIQITGCPGSVGWTAAAPCPPLFPPPPWILPQLCFFSWHLILEAVCPPQCDPSRGSQLDLWNVPCSRG